MHRSRQWTILTLLGLVGLVFMSPMGSGELHAQTIESVTILEPGKVGIDSVFYVDVKIKDFAESKDVGVVVFLAATRPTAAEGTLDTLIIGSGFTGDITEIKQGLTPAVTPSEEDLGDFNDGARGRLSEGDTRVIFSPCGISDDTAINPADEPPIATNKYCGNGNNPIAAFRKRGFVVEEDSLRLAITTYNQAGTPNTGYSLNTTLIASNPLYYQGNADGKGGTKETFKIPVTGGVATETLTELELEVSFTPDLWAGDADSLFLAKDTAGKAEGGGGLGQTYYIRWVSFGSVIMGEHDKIRAGAAIFEEGADTVPLDLVLSAEDNTMEIDGDRPVQGATFHFTEEDATGTGGWSDPKVVGSKFAKAGEGRELQIVSDFADLSGLEERDFEDASTLTEKESKRLFGDGITDAKKQDRIVLGITDTLRTFLRVTGEVEAYSRIRTNLEDDWKIVQEVGGRPSTSDVGNLWENSPGDVSTRSVLERKDVIKDGEYGDIGVDKEGKALDFPGKVLSIAAYMVDGAGNRAAALSIDGPAADPDTVKTALLIDGNKPSLATIADDRSTTAVDEADTFVFVPAKVSGGHPGGADLPADENPIVYKLPEVLDSLIIEMKSKIDGDRNALRVPIGSGGSYGAKALQSGGQLLTVDLSGFSDPFGDEDSEVEMRDEGVEVYAGAEKTVEVTIGLREEQGLGNGLLNEEVSDYKITFTPTDMAGNKGDAVTLENVSFDLKDIDYETLFPFKSDLDTLGTEGMRVAVELDKSADSLIVFYENLDPTDSEDAKHDTLSEGDPAGFPVGLDAGVYKVLPSPRDLEDEKKYKLRMDLKDGAGNWVRFGPEEFIYVKVHDLAAADSFTVVIQGQEELEVDEDGEVIKGGLFGDSFTDENNDLKDEDGELKTQAGEVITVKLFALVKKTGKEAFLHREAATLTVNGAEGLDLVGGDKSPGARQPEDQNNVIELDGAGWGSNGEREVSFRDTISGGRITLALDGQDRDGKDIETGTTSNPNLGVTIEDNEYGALLVKLEPSLMDTVTKGEEFTVEVSIADTFGNVREEDAVFTRVTVDQIGVSFPGDVSITKGKGRFPGIVTPGATADKFVITVRDINQQDNGGGFVHGTSDTIHVREDPDVVVVPPPVDPVPPPVVGPPAAPDTVVAEDYMGARGTGDQGGFVLLTWVPSADHDDLDLYRIYREIAVTTSADENGEVVTLEEPTTQMVPWGTLDPIPLDFQWKGGPEPDGLIRAVVATLDTHAVAFGVGAEIDLVTANKQAFTAGESVANQYELMARTMSRSREAALPVSEGPVFATLTPEALEFQAKGIVPLFKSVDEGILQSALALSNVVRAIDNLPPGPVPYLQVLDTPGDAGGSIRVKWTLSPDDRMLTSTVGSSVGMGGNVYTVPGVKGYNVYRKIGDAAFELIGHAPGGGNSFDDATVFNGVRYTYQVRPTDVDNETPSELEGTAMAIRNRVLDANGNVVFGLFGSDNRVGFDDFFILADQFGLTAEDEGFEPAFDLSPNNKIDLNDFFTFADFFGRTVEGAGRALPLSMAGLNSDARFYLDAGTELPRVGEEMAILVSLEDFAELKAYGLSVSYDPQVLTYVEARVENSILGSGEFADGQLMSRKDGVVSVAVYGDVAIEGDLGLSLVFRSLKDIEDSYIEIVDGEVRDGNYGLNTLDSPVSVRIQTRPEVYALRNNYPNPFNPETTLKYDLPEAGDVKLEVYNMLGQVVRTLVNEHQTAGRYAVQWDATNDLGQNMSSGIYFYRVRVGGEFTDVKKMLLLK